MATELEKIVIRVEADLATLKKGLADGERQTRTSSDKMAASLKNIGSVAGRVGKVLAGMGIAAAAGLTVLIKAGLETADAIDKGAKSANISTTAFQELSYAAALSGMSQGQLSVALESFNRRMGLAKDGTKLYSDALRELGVDMEDASGNFKTTEQLMEETLVALAEIEDKSLQAARASIIYGDDAGKKLPLMMKGGIQGLRDMRQEIHDLNAVLSEDLIGKSVAAKDTLTGLEFVLKNSLAVAVAENAGAIQDLAKAIITAIPKLVEATRGALEFLGIIDTGPRSRLAKAREMRSSLLADGFQPGAEGIGTAAFDVSGKFSRAFASKRYGIDLSGATDEGGQVEILNNYIRALEEQVALEEKIAKARAEALKAALGGGGTKPEEPVDIMNEMYELHVKVNNELLKAQNTEESRLKLLEAQQHARREQYQALTDIEGLAPEVRQNILDTLEKLESVELDNLTKEIQDAKDAARGLGDSLNQAFQNAVLNGENFIKVLGRMLKQVILFGQDGKGGIFGGLLDGIFGGIGGFFGDGIGGLFGFAEGGRPMPRRAAVVGENGPELFIPDSSGTVFNNREFGSMMRSQGQGVVQYWTLEQSIHFDTMLESVDQRIAQSTPQLIEAAKTGVQDAMQRGGTFAKTVRGF